MLRKALAFFSLLMLGLSAASAHASTSNKWRLQFSGGSHSAGEIVIELTPVGADAIVVTIPVPDHESENGVAKHVVEVLRAKLPEDGFHVERDDGEDVLIKKRHGAADFGLRIVSNSVKHVHINLDRE